MKTGLGVIPGGPSVLSADQRDEALRLYHHLMIMLHHKSPRALDLRVTERTMTTSPPLLVGAGARVGYVSRGSGHQISLSLKIAVRGLVEISVEDAAAIDRVIAVLQAAKAALR